jgi:hypothetical protein
MKKLLLMLSLSAVVVLLFAPVASAQQNRYASPSASAMASPTASAMASPSATATASASASATASASAMASASATATASPSATATASPLPSTGGPELVLPVTLVATLVLIGSGFGALALVRR